MIQSPRVILIVLDGAGIGELPDADKYGDKNTNTIGNTAREVGGLYLPVLQQMGLGNLTDIKGVSPNKNSIASFGKAKEVSAGKDSTSGHWELMGLQTSSPFPSFPEGFPDKIIEQFIDKTGCKDVLGNKAASGTTIINELGEKHLNNHYPIIYTSADSVFQVAAHEDVISVDKLYEMCRIARNEILVGEHSVGRVIARPFLVDKNGNFERTPRRKDFSVDPPQDTLLDNLFDVGIPVTGIGKIEDLFNNHGITYSNHTQHNPEAIKALVNTMDSDRKGFIFVNLPDFDTAWGHRNNYQSFAKGLEQFDSDLSDIIEKMYRNDILIVTADHGCDPTTQGTDHTREYIPVLIYGPPINSGLNIGVRDSFSDIGATIADIFDVKTNIAGKSFWEDIVLSV